MCTVNTICTFCCNSSSSGVWNAPYVGEAVLFNGEWLTNNVPNYHSDSYDPDMTWCQWMRDNVSCNKNKK